MNTTPKTKTLDAPATSRLQQLLPYVLVVILSVYLVMQVNKAQQSEGMSRFDFDALGRVPVSEDGRIKPLDTVARNALLVVSGKQSLTGEMLLPSEGDAKRPAVLWLAEVMARRPEAFERKVIRIDDPGILGLMGKTPEDGKYYSVRDLMDPPVQGEPSPMDEIGKSARLASEVRDDQRSQFQEHVIGLTQKFSLIRQITELTRPFLIPPVEAGQDWAPMNIFDEMRGLAEYSPAAREREEAQIWIDIVNALGEDKPEAFNASVQKQLALVSEHAAGPSKKAAFEQGFNRYEPFIKGAVFYGLAGFLGLLAMLLRPILPAAWYTTLWRSGLGVLILTFALHTAALLVRIWLQGRPPVTNLYSSAVFIGWALVGGSIVLERITKLGVASLAASCGGVITLIVAHHLSKEGDTMGVMQAVLDSNFWLSTHVITITLGYSATFLAGFIALIYIIFGIATPILDRKMARAMAGMVYAVVCFALLFSFVGTVLGGIWADQSWGRFWGWDPKENGAILIVLMNAIILHARWGHMVKERGLMVLAVGGNIITAWSWFGTNLLGVGLHSYGFMDGAMFWMAGFVASQMLIMAAALIVPTNRWVSFRKPRKPGSDGSPKSGLTG